MRRVGAGYTNLEFDLADRPARLAARAPRRPAARRDRRGGGLATNNTAAGLTLALATLAAGREVIVSRGELVEIGGGFRVPEILRVRVPSLREVGTTNRTRVADYAAAISDRTAAILRVHPSNFRMEGFTERPALADLAGLAHRFSVPLIEDQGSGWLGLDLFAPDAFPPEARACWRANRQCATACARAPTSSRSVATSCWADRRQACSSARRPRREHPAASAHARRASRQGDVCGARGHAARVHERPGRDGRTGDADARDAARGHYRARGGAGHPPAIGWHRRATRPTARQSSAAVACPARRCRRAWCASKRPRRINCSRPCVTAGTVVIAASPTTASASICGRRRRHDDAPSGAVVAASLSDHVGAGLRLS